MATDLTGMNLDQLIALRRKLAQAANRQMRRLTAAGFTKGNAMSQWALPYLERQGRTRFSERKTPFEIHNPYKETKAGVRLKTDAEIRAEQMRMERREIAQLERFMESKSYHIKDIKEQRQKARDAFRAEFGLEVPDETIDEMFEVKEFEWLRQTFGYVTLTEAAQAINKGQATAEEVKKKINEVRLKYNEKEMKDWTVERTFKEMGLEWKPEFRQQRR